MAPITIMWNGTNYHYVEWHQLPTAVGVDLNTDISDIKGNVFHFFVSVEGLLYVFTVMFNPVI